MLSSSLTQSLYLLAPLYQSTLAQSTGFSYSLQDNYEGTSFFDGFSFFAAADPTHGYVTYVDQATAQQNGLISTTSSTVYIGVDYTSVLDPSGAGRQSVRVESTATYSDGLFIGDFAHMPGGICGVWPAWWTYGANWPDSGEIDIIENANAATKNLMSLHTDANCTIAGADETGVLVTNDCDQASVSQAGTGCGVSNPNTNSYGAGFNANGGGVYAMEWTSSSIRAWFFPRGSIPSDITAGTPAPATWGTPFSNFQGSCDIPTHFFTHKMVFDTTFCGDWAGAVFGSDPVCSLLADTCADYVALNPAAFAEAYWAINSIKVYQQEAVVSPISASSTVLSTSSSTSLPPSATNSQTTPSSIVQSTSSGNVVSASLSIVQSTSLSPVLATSSIRSTTSPQPSTSSSTTSLSSVLPILSTRPLSTTAVPAGETGNTSGVTAPPTSSPMTISQIPATANVSALATNSLPSTTTSEIITSVVEVTTTPIASTYIISTYTSDSTTCDVRVTQIADGQIQAPRTVCSVSATQTTPALPLALLPTWLTTWTTTVTSSDCPSPATVWIYGSQTSTSSASPAATSDSWWSSRSRRRQAYKRQRSLLRAVGVDGNTKDADKSHAGHQIVRDDQSQTSQSTERRRRKVKA